MPGSCSCRPCQADAVPPHRAAAFFLRFVGELGFHYIVVERAYSLSKVDAVERKPCAQSSPPGAIAAHDPQRLVQRVVGHWHAIFIGRPADRGSASRDRRFRRRALRAHDKDPPLTPQYHVRSIPPGFRVRAGFDSGRGDCGDRNGMGVPAAVEPAVLFLPVNTARHLVGISVGIGSHRR